MSRIGDFLGRGGRPRVGEGFSLDPRKLPEPLRVSYENFSAGILLLDAPEDLPIEGAAYALDMEVTRQDRLIRAPGILEIDDEDPRSLRHIFEQASIDYASELVAIDPPWLGFKGAGTWTWVNLGIAATGDHHWVAANIAGTLITSNGTTASYTRAANAVVVTDITAQIIAQTFGLAFGRTLAGAVTTVAGFQALMLAWNAASGAVGDWTGLGAGAEFLLSDNTEADRIIAIQSIGWGVVGILCRKSLWVGYPTGQFDRPVDSQLRVAGLGCVAEPTVVSTIKGATFLSDEGVVDFNTNGIEIISEQINGELLPLDYTNLSAYKAVYLPQQRRYVLSTPVAVWVYDYPIPEVRRPGRWFRRGLLADNLVTFTDQSGLVTWDQLVGTWDEQTLQWNQIVQSASVAPSRLYATLGSKLGREDYGTTSYFGVAQAPVWRTPFQNKQDLLGMFSTLGVHLSYRAGAECSITIRTPDHAQDFTQSVTKTLPATGTKLSKIWIPFTTTGKGAALELAIASGQPEIARVVQILQPAGQALGSL